MSNTLRKDRNNNIFKESLKKKSSTSRYRCRCERCIGKKDTLDKIAEKELKTEIKNDEYTFYKNGNYIDDFEFGHYEDTAWEVRDESILKKHILNW